MLWTLIGLGGLALVLLGVFAARPGARSGKKQAGDAHPYGADASSSECGSADGGCGD